MRKRPMTIHSLAERKKLVVKEYPNIQSREKQDDDTNQLSEQKLRVKKHVRVVAVSIEVIIMPLTE